jgi:hypothetical protein
MTFSSMGFELGPIVPDSGPEPPSGRAVIDALLRRQAAARVRPFNRVRAAELEAPNGALTAAWRAAALTRERDERVASVRRQIAAERAAQEFAQRRAAAHMAQEKARFMRSLGR